MLPDKLPDHVHRKRAKGRVYLYFDTGTIDAKGKEIFIRLPDYGTTEFFRAYAKLKDKRDGKAAPACLMVPTFCDLFERSARFKSRSANTRASYTTYLKVIRREFNTFPAAEVEPKDIVVLLDKMSGTPGAANQTVRLISTLYSWGKAPKIGHVQHNPAEGAELFEHGEYEPWPEPLLTEALAADDPKIRLVSALLYYTGQRIGDVLAMRWSAVQRAHMLVKQEKTDTELEISLHRDLAALLAEMPRGLTTIVCKRDGTPYHVSTVRDWLKEFAAARGVKAVPHGLRKNAVNTLLEVGCTEAEVSAVTGQSLQIIAHYAKKRDRKKLSGRAMRKWENVSCP